MRVPAPAPVPVPPVPAPVWYGHIHHTRLCEARVSCAFFSFHPSRRHAPRPCHPPFLTASRYVRLHVGQSWEASDSWCDVMHATAPRVRPEPPDAHEMPSTCSGTHCIVSCRGAASMMHTSASILCQGLCRGPRLARHCEALSCHGCCCCCRCHRCLSGMARQKEHRPFAPPAPPLQSPATHSFHRGDAAARDRPKSGASGKCTPARRRRGSAHSTPQGMPLLPQRRPA
mmetsp:Transcript_26519/g.65691  ORF Transcript_26519/g.65691 Transcript_26519/m.65691 type:complete len:229 (-) Transcript_26519:753-1439(-)